MSDLKSKLPDVSELTSMAGKLFKDVKTSVCEIIDSYKEKREHEASTKPAETHVEKTEVSVTVKKKTTAKDDDAPAKEEEKKEE